MIHVKYAALPLLLAALLSTAAGVSACSSFAVYADEIYYGMNFDFEPHTDVRLAVRPHSDGYVFLGSFEHEGQWLDMAGMNSLGLFANLQTVPPLELENAAGASMILPQLKAVSLQSAGHLAEVLDILGDARLVHVPGFHLHSLYADMYGRAAVVEAGAEENYIEKIDGQYMVMTNFNHSRRSEEAGLDGAGLDRFRTAEKIMASEWDGFSWQTGMDLLEVVSLGEKTRVSLVFRPEQNTVYAAVGSEFERIWKLDLEQQTIEGYRGFDGIVEKDIPRRGIRIQELLEPN